MAINFPKEEGEGGGGLLYCLQDNQTGDYMGDETCRLSVSAPSILPSALFSPPLVSFSNFISPLAASDGCGGTRRTQEPITSETYYAHSDAEEAMRAVVTLSAAPSWVNALKKKKIQKKNAHP